MKLSSVLGATGSQHHFNTNHQFSRLFQIISNVSIFVPLKINLLQINKFSFVTGCVLLELKKLFEEILDRAKNDDIAANSVQIVNYPFFCLVTQQNNGGLNQPASHRKKPSNQQKHARIFALNHSQSASQQTATVAKKKSARGIQV